MIPLGVALRIAPYALCVAVGLAAVHRIRAGATAVAEQAAALANETARANGLALAVTTLRGHVERAAQAASDHRRTVHQYRATLDADQAALANLSDACLDTALPDDLRQRLRDAPRPVDPDANTAADARAAQPHARGGL